MTYFLDDISPALATIAHTFAVFGVNSGPSYIEEFRVIESKLREIYPNGLPRDHTFGAALAINALIIAFAAAEARQREIEARSKRHIELAEQERAIKQAREQGGDDLLHSYLAETKPTKSELN